MTFAAPLFFIGFIALAIPVVVHLFNFRRYKKVYFSNVEYLEQVQSETRKQSTLRRWLILAARLLALTFLVLAFAQPVIPSKNAVLKSGGSDVSIYIDNSFSMENTNGGEPLLDQAKRKAREIVSAYQPSDRFQLLTNDVEGRQFHWLSREEMLSAIDEVEVSPATLPLSSIAQKVFDFIRSGVGKNKYAYFVSDFQTSVSDFDNLVTDTLVRTFFIPLQAEGLNNVFIDSVSLNAPVFCKGNSVTVEVHMRNDGDENLEKVPVSLFLNDRQRAMATVDLAANSNASVDMHFTIDETGILSGRIETNDYPVTFDDRYYFSLNIRDHIHMLVVEGRQENEFLKRLFLGDSVVSYSSMSLQQMDFSRLDANDIVLLDELPSFSTGMAQSVHSFVERGGTAVVVVGERIDEASYNQALQMMSAPRLESYSTARVAAGTVNLDDDLYRNVFNGRSDNMELPSVTGYYRCKASGSTLRRSIINLANGDDYVICTPCGEGKLYLITAPLRDEHTDFVRQALFVPTLYNMALYSLRPTPLAAPLDYSGPLPLSQQYASEGNVRLVSLDGTLEEIPDIRHVAGNYTLLPHGTLREAGNYRLLVDGKPVEGLSFNYSRQESRMNFLSVSELNEQLKDNNIVNYSVVRNPDKPLDTYLKQQMEGTRLWRWCVILCLLMLLVEVLLIKIPIRTKNNIAK
ncbi:MAG: BatA domain-containing protein [Bacteroidales bacterium]|nr:BatA domain-containing protein [Bacteroidales bacterium]